MDRSIKTPSLLSYTSLMRPPVVEEPMNKKPRWRRRILGEQSSTIEVEVELDENGDPVLSPEGSRASVVETKMESKEVMKLKD